MKSLYTSDPAHRIAVALAQGGVIPFMPAVGRIERQVQVT